MTDTHSKPLAGLRLLAIPRDNADLWDAEDPFTPLNEDPAAPFAHTDADGAFVFRGLPRGDYRLAIDESNWMLEEPIFFRADMNDLPVVATRARSLVVRARDLATHERIARFTVRYRWPPDAPGQRVGRGQNGLFRARVPAREQERVPCNVEAEGYHGTLAFMRPNDIEAWLVRAVEPTLVIRVTFEDGAPCDEDACVVLWHRGGQATLAAVRTGSGRYQAGVPPGTWTLEFRPEKLLVFREGCTAKFEMAEGERREIFLKMERGGDLVVGRKHWDGKPWWASVQGGEINFRMQVAEAAWETRHLRPGRYVVALLAGDDAAWQREIEVTTGSRHELTIE